MILKCSNCSLPISPGKKFCVYCGQPVEEILSYCEKCGHQYELTDKFCGNCGNNLKKEEGKEEGVEPAPSSEPEKTESENLRFIPQTKNLEKLLKHATVLFADIQGSTTLIQDLDPEEARDLLSPSLQEMLSAIYQHSGTIVHTAGDGIIAVFGAPQAIEDHALRACLASVAMRSKVKSINESLKMRIGLHSGEVFLETVGDEQHQEYDIIGSAVHLAARMEQTAKPGTIQMTKDTLILVEENVEVAPLGEIIVKGFNQPLETFELLSIKESKSLYEKKDRPRLLPFVSREKELKLLNEFLSYSKSGKGNCVGIVGEAGQGKSRLVYEFSHSDAIKDCMVLGVGGFSHTSNILLFPIINLFRNIMHVIKTDDPETVRKKIQPYIANLNSPYAVSAILALLNIPSEDKTWNELNPQIKRKTTLNICVEVLMEQAKNKPLVMIIEDLHWVDNETEAFLDLLISRMHESHILLLVTFRPKYKNDYWMNKSNYTQITLAPLTQENAEFILDEILGKDLHLLDIKHKLLATCGGNPFFLEQMLQSLINDKTFIGESQSYSLSAPNAANKIQLPGTILAVLQTKIDELPLIQKKILQVSAVIGERFTYSLLTQLTDINVIQLRKEINMLIDNQFIYETQVYPEPEFSFRHGLIHEVAYKTMLKKQRRLLHSNILAILKQSKSENIDLQVMANHAYLSEEWDQTFYYCEQAGSALFLRCANKLSSELYHRALLASEHLPKTEELIQKCILIYIRLFIMSVQLSRFEDQPEYLNKGMKLALSVKNKLMECSMYNLKAMHSLGIGKVKESLKFNLHACELADKLQDTGAIVTTKTFLVPIYLLLGSFTKAYQTGNEVLKFMPSIDYQPPLYPFPLGYIISLHIHRAYACTGNFSILENKEAPWIVAANIKQPSVKSLSVIGALAFSYYVKGEFAEAIEYLSQALFYSSELETIVNIPIYAAPLGCSYLYLNNLEEGRIYINHAINIAQSIKFTFLSVIVLDVICEGLLLLKEFELAKEFSEQALKIASESGLEGQKASLLRIAAEIDLNLPNPDHGEIKKKLDKALQITRKHNMLPNAGHCHFTYAKLYQQIGDVEKYQNELNNAFKYYKKLGMTFWLTQCQQALNLSFAERTS